jgi:hypothetical protein
VQDTLEPVQRLSRDLVKAATTIGVDEARFLVDAYYQLQGARVRAGNQELALEKEGEPNGIIGWLHEQNESLENQIKRTLDRYTESVPEGRWLKSITGVGPVISAGLISRLKVEYDTHVKEADRKRGVEPKYVICHTAGHFMSYAGLTPGQQRIKGEKLQFDPGLKRIMWLAGECFVKVKNHEEDVYGKLIEERKLYEAAKNDAGDYKEQAAEALAKKKKFDKSKDAYKAYIQGKLPLGHLHARAKRYAVKILLSHYHTVAYWMRFEKLPPRPFAMEHRGHAHYIFPPNTHLIPGLKEALQKEYGQR